MKILLYCLKKEFLLIWRNKILLRVIIAMPLIQLLIFPFAADMDVRNLEISVVDNDRSSYSTQLIHKIAASDLFKLYDISDSYEDALKDVEVNHVDLILHIPAGFERNLIREGNQQVAISADAINGVKAGLGSNYLTSIIQDFNQQIRLEWISPSQLVAPINVRYSYWFNPNTDYKFYMVPGILALLITIMTGFLAALNIVAEKEIGTMEQINVTPLKRWQFILGKLIPFLVIGLLIFSIGIIIQRYLYGIHIQGSLFDLYAFTFAYIVAILGLGLFISTLANTQQQSMFVAFFFIMIIILMSGLFTTISSMPGWAQIVANIIPMTHYNTAIRSIVLKGTSIMDLWKDLALIVAFAFVMTTAAINNYKKTS